MFIKKKKKKEIDTHSSYNDNTFIYNLQKGQKQTNKPIIYTNY